MLGRNRAARACIDLSDGLADGVRQIGEASGLGAIIEADALPLEDGATLRDALGGGEDYELLFAVSPRMRSRLKNVRRLVQRSRGHAHRAPDGRSRDALEPQRQHGRAAGRVRTFRMRQIFLAAHLSQHPAGGGLRAAVRSHRLGFALRLAPGRAAQGHAATRSRARVSSSKPPPTARDTRPRRASPCAAASPPPTPRFFRSAR